MVVVVVVVVTMVVMVKWLGSGLVVNLGFSWVAVMGDDSFGVESMYDRGRDRDSSRG